MEDYEIADNRASDYGPAPFERQTKNENCLFINQVDEDDVDEEGYDENKSNDKKI